jgi:hypothetical protein
VIENQFMAMSNRRFGRKPTFPSRVLVFVVAALLDSIVCAQDQLLSDLFPDVELTRYFANSATDLYVSAYARIESRGKQYVALTYYEPYPNAPRLRYVNYALLELVGEEYAVRLDQVATDDGSGQGFQNPFLYTVDAADLVVFSRCYRGCRYSFFRLNTTPIQVTLQDYDDLSADESLSGNGDYRFDDSGLSALFRVARSGDPTCCPSRGTLHIFYELRGNQFQIARAERKESVEEAQ